jgi:hypothetical protein
MTHTSSPGSIALGTLVVATLLNLKSPSLILARVLLSIFLTKHDTLRLIVLGEWVIILVNGVSHPKMDGVSLF